MLAILIDDLEKGHVITTFVIEGNSDVVTAQLRALGSATVTREAVENADAIGTVVAKRIAAADAARDAQPEGEV